MIVLYFLLFAGKLWQYSGETEALKALDANPNAKIYGVECMVRNVMTKRGQCPEFARGCTAFYPEPQDVALVDQDTCNLVELKRVQKPAPVVLEVKGE